MKTKLLYVVTASCFVGVAHAQGSMTLYGIIDEGVNYISNDNGKSNVTLTSSVAQGSRWGLRGVEDLGGGTKAIFVLENGFSASNGTLSQGGRLFGRQSYVGLSNSTLGTLTFGRQYDSQVDFVQVLTHSAYTGLAHPFDNDNLDDTSRINNSVKYTSPDFKGLKFGGMYAFGNTTDFAANRVWSLGAGYTHGSLVLGAGYLHMNTPNSNTVGAIATDYTNVSTTSPLGANGLSSAVLSEDIWSAGGSYTLNGLTAGFIYSHSIYRSATDSLKFDNYEANLAYSVTPALKLFGMYSFTDGDLSSTQAKPKYHQIELMVDYFLSKRTDVYLLGAYQRAAGDANMASIAPDTFGPGGSLAPDASTTKNQALARIAIRHKF